VQNLSFPMFKVRNRSRMFGRSTYFKLIRLYSNYPRTTCHNPPLSLANSTDSAIGVG